MIVGTAGHIDHGKSALVTALTGRPMDRLAEERRRGITIDLGFAPLDLGDGRVAGLVDVPGHEDFVRTMVAGASGIDVALLVVAADEGPMPQTLEHLTILEQLAVPRGIPVVTKCDLVEPEWLELVLLDLAERVGRSTIRFGAPLAVSALRGTGLDELRDALRAMAAELDGGRPGARPGARHGARAADAFRMPVDRAFSVAGVGTVVTGTAWSGAVEVGGTVRILPGGDVARVRSVESHGVAVPRSEAGARTALGLGGVERAAVRRGQVVVTDELPWTPTRALDVLIALAPDAPRPLAPRSRVRVHLGTAELMARVHPRGSIEPGGGGLARLVLEGELVARGGDRFVLRSYSPVTTIGGGRVLDPLPPRRGAPRGAWPDGLASDDPAARAVALVTRRRWGASAGELPLLLGVAPREAAPLLRNAPALRRVGDYWVPLALATDGAARALALVTEYHRARAADPGMPLETLRRELRLPEWLAAAVLDDLTGDGRLVSADGVARSARFRPQAAGGDAQIERLVAAIETAGLAPPSVGELEGLGGRDTAAALRLAAAAGRVVAVERDRYFAPAALAGFEAALRELGAAGAITPAALRERLGLTRKFLIPLLEWADRRGLTRRVGDARVLAGPA